MAELIIYALNLQLFAEGASAAPAGDGGQAAATETGETIPDAGGRRGRSRKPDPFADVVFGIDESAEPTQQPQPEAKKSFEELIKGDYKQDFDNRVNDIIQKRFKAGKAQEERLQKLNPILEQLAGKYGLEIGENGVDIDALGKAVSDDDEWMEQKAAEKGMSLETYKLVDKLERDAKRREEQDRATFEEQQRRAKFELLVQQSEQAKQFYPGFNLEQEIGNPEFVRLTSLGIDARTAYEVIHRDEILGGAMQVAAQTAAQKVAASVRSGQRRPQENGLGSGAPGPTRLTDPSKFTKAQREELRRRVARGDKVVL